MVRKEGVYKIWDYLGNLMTVSLVGSLFLVLILIFGHLFGMQHASEQKQCATERGTPGSPHQIVSYGSEWKV